MTTSTSDPQTRALADIDAREREAWTSYRESVRDLEGQDYEDVEGRSWERLQGRLKKLDDERQLVETD